MQFILDVIAAALIWLAAVAFGHFGIKVDLPDRHPPKAERVIQRTPAPARASVEAQTAKTNPECPELQTATLKHV